MRTLITFLIFVPFFLIAQEDIQQYNKGVKAHNANDYPTAIDCYQKCLAINPKNKDALNNIGIAYYNHSLEFFNQKDYDKSIEYCQKALKYNAKNPDIHYMIGLALRNQKKYTEAIASYSKAIELSEQPASLYAARAWIYNDLHQHKSRLADMKKAVEHEPTNAEYQFHCGKFKQEVSPEEFKTAGENYNKAIELNPNYVEAYTERAAFYMTFEKFEKALVDLKKAKELGADVSHLIEAAQFELEMQND
ncbi:tetratricopeptide repeat protein [Aureispira anguillae]|uniref:Tetratricopeptide repeat protein n=1 Tax=Aureispira anguillae TaxID=2864201 RepID=A0A916DWA5_9BACT|nr:tetratricopeptide repeat protein [Aureispira anguillae]BDS15261.1 tetratricopeptide repeat protein [Aureispira anguillae]